MTPKKKFRNIRSFKTTLGKIEGIQKDTLIYSAKNNKCNFVIESDEHCKELYNTLLKHFPSQVKKYDFNGIVPMAQQWAKNLNRFYLTNENLWNEPKTKEIYNPLCDRFDKLPHATSYNTGYLKGNFLDFDMISAFPSIIRYFGPMMASNCHIIEYTIHSGSEIFNELINNKNNFGIVEIENAYVSCAGIRTRIHTRNGDKRQTLIEAGKIAISLDQLRVLMKLNMISSQFKITIGQYFTRDPNSEQHRKFIRRFDSYCTGIKELFPDQPKFCKLFINVGLYGLRFGHSNNTNSFRMSGLLVTGFIHATMTEMVEAIGTKNIACTSVDGILLRVDKRYNNLTKKGVIDTFNNLSTINPMYIENGKVDTIRVKHGGINLLHLTRGSYISTYDLSTYDLPGYDPIISYEGIDRYKCRNMSNLELTHAILNGDDLNSVKIFEKEIELTYTNKERLIKFYTIDKCLVYDIIKETIHFGYNSNPYSVNGMQNKYSMEIRQFSVVSKFSYDRILVKNTNMCVWSIEYSSKNNICYSASAWEKYRRLVQIRIYNKPARILNSIRYNDAMAGILNASEVISESGMKMYTEFSNNINYIAGSNNPYDNVKSIISDSSMSIDVDDDTKLEEIPNLVSPHIYNIVHYILKHNVTIKRAVKLLVFKDYDITYFTKNIDWTLDKVTFVKYENKHDMFRMFDLCISRDTILYRLASKIIIDFFNDQLRKIKLDSMQEYKNRKVDRKCKQQCDMLSVKATPLSEILTLDNCNIIPNHKDLTTDQINDMLSFNDKYLSQSGDYNYD